MSALLVAPLSWGVAEQSGWGYQLAAERVASEARELNVGLAPPDLPPFSHRNQLPAAEARILEAKKAGARVIVTTPPAGELDLRGWASYLDALGALDALCRRHRLELALEPRFRSAIDGEERLQHLLAGSDVGLCLDAGEFWLCGIDPLDVLELEPRRVRHVHLKDLDPAVGGAVREGRLGRWEATFKGLFPPLGEGVGAAAELVGGLRRAGYGGALVLEQDRVLAAEPPPGEGPVRELRRSLDFLGRLVD